MLASILIASPSGIFNMRRWHALIRLSSPGNNLLHGHGGMVAESATPHKDAVMQPWLLVHVQRFNKYQLKIL